jgi:Flp pilus assembly protein TadD
MNLPDEETIQLHNTLMQGASDLLFPYLEFPERSAKDSTTPEGRAAVERACAMLKRVIQINPENWNAMWLLGMGFNVIGQPHEAYEAFAAAYRVQKDNPEVGRQLVLACLTLGKGPEATLISEEIIERWPNDPGLLANYALALLISDRLVEAHATINRSLQLDPDDPVSHNVLRMVTRVQTGQMLRPSKLHP